MTTLVGQRVVRSDITIEIDFHNLVAFLFQQFTLVPYITAPEVNRHLSFITCLTTEGILPDVGEFLSEIFRCPTIIGRTERDIMFTKTIPFEKHAITFIKITKFTYILSTSYQGFVSIATLVLRLQIYRQPKKIGARNATIDSDFCRLSEPPENLLFFFY